MNKAIADEYVDMSEVSQTSKKSELDGPKHDPSPIVQSKMDPNDPKRTTSDFSMNLKEASKTLIADELDQSLHEEDLVDNNGQFIIFNND